jgi:ribosome-associated toxin RatA of RatAB toxin-antitoxin module
MAELETNHLFRGDINKVFTALGQFERYPEFIPGVTAVQVLPPKSGSKAKCQVKTELNIVKTFFYTIEIFEQAPNKIWWTLIESNLMKHNNGSWDLSKSSENETAAIYKLDVAFRGLVPSMVTDQIARANLPQMFVGFQKLIDSVS